MRSQQRGISLIGFIFLGMILIFVGITLAKVAPAYIEFFGVKKALHAISTEGNTTAKEVRSSFDRRANVEYITSVQGSDLEITKNRDKLAVSVEYAKKIPLFANVSIYLDFKASTEANDENDK